jgi:hypothetical protein
MSRKVFTADEVLTAEDVNSLLMDQTVMSFAGTAARGSAIPFPVEGMVTYLEDSNSMDLWNGSQWSQLNPQRGNAIINGAFDYWQRGTSGFSLGGAFNADRWGFYTSVGTNKSVSRQSFTPGDLNAPSFGDANFYWRYAETVATVADENAFYQPIEDVRTFANQTVTLSFYARSSSASSTITPRLTQVFGSGGSTSVATAGTGHTLTTSWARYSQTFVVPSISSKTIGANNFIQLTLGIGTNRVQNVDIWGIQLEAGLTATPFRRNANSLQGELAACQRYFVTKGRGSLFGQIANGFATGTNQVRAVVEVPTQLRVTPTSVTFSNLAVWDGVTSTSVTGVILDVGATAENSIRITVSVASGLTTYRPYTVFNDNNTAGFLSISSEL